MIRFVVDYLPEYPEECPFAKYDSKYNCYECSLENGYECDEKLCRDCMHLCEITEFVRRK